MNGLAAHVIVGRTRHSQRGVAAVEFGLLALLFFSLLLGIMEFGRVLFTWNVAAEATRFGARVAVVCDPGSAGVVLSKMQKIMPGLTAGNLNVSYIPSGCAVNACTRVTVSLSGMTITPMIPLLDATLPVPPFTTTLPRESLSSAVGPDPDDVNALCS